VTTEEKVRRFEKALAYAGNTHDVSDVLDRIGQQKAVCWTHGDSVVVTEVLSFPSRRVCTDWIVAGTL
jgi:hypothetical protein